MGTADRVGKTFPAVDAVLFLERPGASIGAHVVGDITLPCGMCWDADVTGKGRGPAGIEHVRRDHLDSPEGSRRASTYKETAPVPDKLVFAVRSPKGRGGANLPPTGTLDSTIAEAPAEGNSSLKVIERPALEAFGGVSEAPKGAGPTYPVTGSPDLTVPQATAEGNSVVVAGGLVALPLIGVFTHLVHPGC